FLSDFSLVAVEFCRVTIGFLANGINSKLITNAANRLQLDQDLVRNTIENLMWLYTECAKSKISVESLEESLKLFGFNDVIRQTIVECYTTQSSQLQSALIDLSLSLPKYKDLHWRFDVQIYSRNIRHRQVEPYFILKLSITDVYGKDHCHLLQCDPLTLLHIVEQLENAINNLRSNHCRRIMQTFR
ncbi:unnamed protein product, partial [Didymodactylos carnosus]